MNRPTLLIQYGCDTINLVDITQKCMDSVRHNLLFIPRHDNVRCDIFAVDPCPNIVKMVYLLAWDEPTNQYVPGFTLGPYDFAYIEFTLENLVITVNEIPDKWKWKEADPGKNYNEELTTIQQQLHIRHGDFSIEVPEQLMALRFLTGDEKILEIGGNIGRNSLIMGYLLKQKGNSRHMVTLESDPANAMKLEENRIINGLEFQVEPSALSKRKLKQKFWTTYEMKDDELLQPDEIRVHTITWEAFKTKYPIEFDTLVLDCEGAFFTILQENPEFLNLIQKIIVENDYHDAYKKNYVEWFMVQNGFRLAYTENLDEMPEFFQFWRKM